MAAINTEIITLQGAFSRVQIQRRTKDNLPKHVKGKAWWYESTPDQSAYIGYYIGEQPNEQAVEFLRIRSQDNWYILTGHRGKPTYYSMSSDDRVPRENDLNLSWWNIDNKEHPEYYSNLPEPEITPEIEVLSGGLHHITTLKGKNPLHPRQPIIIPALEEHVSQGHEIPVDIESLAAQEPTPEVMASSSIQTTTTAPSEHSPSNGGSLYGANPPQFMGNKDQS